MRTKNSIISFFMKYEKLVMVFISIFVAIIVCWKLIFTNVHFSAIDIRFHLNRFGGLSNVFDSPVNFLTFSGQGKAISIFYPWYLIYPFELINKFVHNYVISYKIYNFSLIFIASQVCYYVTSSFLRSKVQALIITCVYIFSPITSVYLYSLAANGQLLAIIFTPIAIVGILHLFFMDYKKWYFFVIAFALFSIGHLASILIYLIVSFFAFIICIISKKLNKNRFIHIVGAGIISLIFVVSTMAPIIEQRLAYDLFMPPNLEIGKRAYSVFEYFWYSVYNHGLSNLGFICLVGFFTIIICYKFLDCWQRSLAILTIVLVVLMSSIFPWKLVENTLLGQIQDTHRFMLPFVYSVLLIFISLIFKYMKFWNIKYVLLTCVVICFSSILIYASFAFKVVHYDDHNPLAHMSLQPNKIVSYHSPDYENNNDLLKKTIAKSKFTEVYHLQRKYDYRLNGKVVNELVKRSASSVEIKLHANNTSILSTPLSIYKGIIVSVDNKVVNNYLLNKHTGTLFLNLSKGTHDIKISYKYTLVYRICQFVLLLSFILLYPLIYLYKHLRYFDIETT